MYMRYVSKYADAKRAGLRKLILDALYGTSDISYKRNITEMLR